MMFERRRWRKRIIRSA